MKRSHMVVGILCLLLGAVTAFLYSSGKSGKNLVSSNDSPVTVRGGSVVVHSPQGTSWTPYGTSSNIYMMQLPSGHAATLVDLNGADATTGNPAGEYQLGISTNWKILMTFRQKDGKTEDQSKTLQICTGFNGSTCTVDSNPAGSTIYLIGDGTGTFSDAGLDRPGMRYDRPCPSSDAHPDRCNHIHNITVTSYSGSSPSYHCQDGQCSMGIGS